MKYRYSFVIPHYNRPQLLKRLIDSIPERDDVEIIVVDDNSSKELRPRIDRGGCRVIQLEKDQSNGAGRARNVGLREVSGRWVLFADADDYYVPDFLSKLDSVSEKNVDVVYFNILSVYSDTGAPANRADKLNRIIKNYDGSATSIDLLKYSVHGPWFKMIRLDFLRGINAKFEEVKKGNDVFFGYQIGFFAKKIFLFDEKIYCLTYENNSLSFGKKTLDAYIDTIKIHKRMNEFYRFIGRENWIERNWLDYVRPLKQRGMCFFLKFLKQYIRGRNEQNALLYVREIKQMRDEYENSRLHTP